MNNVSPSAAEAIAGALFARSIDDCLEGLNDAERFKASMALKQVYMSEQTLILTFHLSRCGNIGKDLSQNLFDKIFLDLDLSLRELGAGDAGVHIKIKQMINSYMGRQQAYCNCLKIKDFDKLEKHITKNVYRNVVEFGKSPYLLSKYCQKVFFLFENKNDQYFLLNEFNFPKFEY